MPVRVDARNLACPLPIVRLAQALRTVEPGEEIELVASDPAVEVDLPAFCEATGHRLIGIEFRDGSYFATVRCRRGASGPSPRPSPGGRGG